MQWYPDSGSWYIEDPYLGNQFDLWKYWHISILHHRSVQPELLVCYPWLSGAIICIKHFFKFGTMLLSSCIDRFITMSVCTCGDSWEKYFACSSLYSCINFRTRILSKWIAMRHTNGSSKTGSPTYKNNGDIKLVAPSSRHLRYH